MTHAVPRIDAHLHLWDLTSGGYGWLRPEHGDLHANFSPEDVAPSLAAAGVDGAVLVQADDTAADTAYLLDVASRHPWVVGVVGWVQLDDPTRAAAELDGLASFDVLRGIRHLVHDDPRPDFLDLASVRESLRLVAARGLAFDVPDAWPGHLEQIPSLAAELDELTIVIDHLGKPPRDEAARNAWRSALADAAARPNTIAKFSGLTDATAVYSAEGLGRLWNDALELFGPSRMMWGSDWPVSGRTYARIVDPLMELISTLSPDERDAILGRTAAGVYGILEVAR